MTLVSNTTILLISGVFENYMDRILALSQQWDGPGRKKLAGFTLNLIKSNRE